MSHALLGTATPETIWSFLLSKAPQAGSPQPKTKAGDQAKRPRVPISPRQRYLRRRNELSWYVVPTSSQTPEAPGHKME